ncbi:MAG TPA: hypothetical protein VG984_00455 [Candidatus Paceibacterota bacterium]|nr:hypothetical protein [Candidatus Paceibacterota bacterium]
MDELEISGKRYISSKRIAKENRYHADYIGQLIRGGKVIGTKVGRAWYVDEQSFVDYLNKEKTAYIAPEIASEPQPEAISIAVVSEEAKEEKKEEVVPAVEISTIEVLEEKSIAPVAAPLPTPVRHQTLTYIADNRPLFPEIAKRPTPVFAARVQPAAAPRIQENIPPVTITPKKKISIAKKSMLTVSLVSFAALILAVSFFGSLEINSLVTVENGKPASISYIQEATLCFIFKSCQK